MLADEVFAGRAILVLDIPADLCSSEKVTQLFRTTFSRSTAGNLNRVEFNPDRVKEIRSGGDKKREDYNPSDPMEEVAAIEFLCPTAVRHLLDRVDRVFSARENGIELRRGFLQLGDHRLLIEGIVAASDSDPASPSVTGRASPAAAPPAPADGKSAPQSASRKDTPVQRPQPTPDADAVAMHAEDPTAPPAPAEDNHNQTAAGGARGADSPQREGEDAEAPEHHSSGYTSHARSPMTGSPHPEPALPTSTNPSVISLVFRLLYCRPAPGSAHGNARHTFRKDFKLTPYIVYQVLRGSFTPMKVRIAARSLTGQDGTPITTVLVEFGTPKESQEAIRTLHDAIVELMSPVPETHDVKQVPARDNEELRALYKYTMNSEKIPENLPPSKFSHITCSAEIAEARFSVRASNILGEQFPQWFNRDPRTGAFKGLLSCENSHEYLELKSRRELVTGMIGPFFNRHIMKEDECESWHRGKGVAPKQFGGVPRPGATNRDNERGGPREMERRDNIRDRNDRDRGDRDNNRDHYRRRARSESSASSRSSRRPRRPSPPAQRQRRDQDQPRPQSQQQLQQQQKPTAVVAASAPAQHPHPQAAQIPPGVQLPPGVVIPPGYRLVPVPPEQQAHALRIMQEQQRAAAAAAAAAAGQRVAVGGVAMPHMAAMRQAYPQMMMPVNAVPVAVQQPQQQQVRAVTAAAAAPVPAQNVYRDQSGALPPGWRPVYSEEYRQTYYVYRDATGQERTTWTRPVANGGTR